MPSLIVTDHEIPLMNGLQLIQSIRLEDKPLNIPVIAILKTESDELKKSYDEYGIKTILDDSPFLISWMNSFATFLNNLSIF